MSLESRFNPPMPHEEPVVLIHCEVCGREICDRDTCYYIEDEYYCDDCGLDYLQVAYQITLYKEDY